jgi:hypothetical protein
MISELDQGVDLCRMTLLVNKIRLQISAQDAIYIGIPLRHEMLVTTIP